MARRGWLRPEARTFTVYPPCHRITPEGADVLRRLRAPRRVARGDWRFTAPHPSSFVTGAFVDVTRPAIFGPSEAENSTPPHEGAIRQTRVGADRPLPETRAPARRNYQVSRWCEYVGPPALLTVELFGGVQRETGALVSGKRRPKFLGVTHYPMREQIAQADNLAAPDGRTGVLPLGRHCAAWPHQSRTTGPVSVLSWLRARGDAWAVTPGPHLD